MSYIPPFDCRLQRKPISNAVPKALGRCARIGCVTGLFLATVAGPAEAGSLTGRVTLSASPLARTQTARSFDPYAGTLGSLDRAGSTEPNASDPSEVVIYLEGDQLPVTKTRSNAKLYQINQSFEPRVLGIPVGATVDFPNKDVVFHNVFSYSKTKRFDLGYYGQNKSKSVRFDKPGLVKVFCDIHSNMAAFIFVVPTPYVTQAADDGTYLIPDIPNGTYTLKVWHPDRGSKSQTIMISESTQYDIEM